MTGHVIRKVGHRAGNRSRRSNIPSARPGLGQAGVALCRSQIERRIVEGGKTIAAAIGDSKPKAGLTEANAKREADMRIVINNQKATHTAAHALFLAFDSPRLRFAPTLIAL